MTEHAYVYNASGNLINDPDRSLEYVRDIVCKTNWPKGYGLCTFQVSRSIAIQWAVKQAYRLQIKDGLTIIFEGRIENLDKALSGNDETITVTAVGWYQVLEERRIRKHWVDNEPVSRMVWPANRETSQPQQAIDANKRDNMILVRGGYGDVVKTAGDAYHELYTAPTRIRRVESSYAIRTGEGITIIWRNEADSSNEVSVTDSSGAQVTGSLNATLAGAATSQLRLIIELDVSDLYDENDRAKIYNIVTRAHYDSSHPDFASPNYTNGEIALDAMIICGQSDISVDYDLITDPNLTMTAFVTAGGDWETADGVIRRVLAYGDSSQNTYGLAVWDSTGTSDGLPKAELKARSVSDYEWAVNLADLEGFSDSPSLDELYNWIIVRYTDNKDQTQFLTPDDNAALQDTTSITTYGERHSAPINIGKATSTEALAIGQRYLAYHKDPLKKSALAIRGSIRTKYGAWLPVNRVRAGDRVRLLDYQGGVTYFIRSTDYSNGLLRMTPDLPPDSVEMILSQRELQKPP